MIKYFPSGSGVLEESHRWVYLKKYVSRLLELWINRVFLALDALGFVTFLIVYFKADFSLPRWAYWIFFAFAFITFLGANVRLFADVEAEKQSLRNRISELEAIEANIRLDFVKAWFNLSHSGVPSPFPEVEIDQFGFDEHGLPSWVSIWAKLKIRDIGYEPGELVEAWS